MQEGGKFSRLLGFCSGLKLARPSWTSQAVKKLSLSAKWANSRMVKPLNLKDQWWIWLILMLQLSLMTKPHIFLLWMLIRRFELFVKYICLLELRKKKWQVLYRLNQMQIERDCAIILVYALCTVEQKRKKTGKQLLGKEKVMRADRWGWEKCEDFVFLI